MKALLIILLFFYSCSSMNRKGELPVLTPFDASSTMDITDVIDSVIYIQLDDTLLLRGLGNQVCTADFIFGTSQYGILMFDRDGHFVRKIGNIGEGPEDYHEYSYRLAVDIENEIIYVLNDPYDVLLSYSFTGDFLQRISLHFMDIIKEYNFPLFFRMQKDRLFLYYGCHKGLVGEKPLYWLSMTPDGRLIEFRRGNKNKITDNKGWAFFDYFTSVDDSTMLYWDYYNDTVFHVAPSRAKAAFLWGQGDFRLQDTDDFTNIPQERMRCSNILDTKNFLLLDWAPMSHYTGNNYFNLYDKRTGKTYRLQEDMIYDKRGDDLSIRYSNINYARIEGREYILTQTKSFNVEKIPGALHKKLDADDLEGNPVIVMIRLKEQ